GFEDSFKNLGPGSSTEEQIAYAYWYGGKRMMEVPAYSLEEFLYEKTERIEVVPYGIETRFWPAGREIPDLKGLGGFHAQPRKTDMEKFLDKKRIPLSELALHSYILDFLFRGELNISSMVDRIIPPLIKITIQELKYIEAYINIELAEISNNYSPFTDKQTGPVRQRICELHTAIIELVFKLENEKIDPSWLPKHTFIILSQIQSHVLGIMEELDSNDSSLEMELEAIDNSLDSMIETYEEMRILIDEAIENYRKNKFSLVRAGPGKGGEWLFQLTIGGTDVWRRLMLSEDSNLEALHLAIQNSFGWNNSWVYQFRAEETLSNSITLKELAENGLLEFLYEYGTKWTVRVILLTRYKATGKKPIRCVTGAGAAPPENIGGPLRYKRLISALSKKNDFERISAERELGLNFNPDIFDMEACNKSLGTGFSINAESSEKKENSNEKI
ncbi:MAG: plasmid pRiA4b ORF-3 family protein, partial [Treponema sp.]|nr:plasmid pRiA4b ORF-3 family protein [Treponema sp.]